MNASLTVSNNFVHNNKNNSYLSLTLIDHSCTDIIIDGEKDLNNFSQDGQPINWPYKNQTMQYYSTEAGLWKDGWLQNVPSDYTTVYSSKFLTCV